MAHTVLVVDDDPIMHRVLQHYLERRGYRLLNAKGGHEALEIATREVPDLILLDVGMPDMSGLTALRHLKDNEKTRATPVIVITSHADRATHVESEVFGAAAFLTKPFRSADLLQLLLKILPPERNQISPTPA
jgi:two-component system, OmpR family, KDP operon response regulator KdpE